MPGYSGKQEKKEYILITSDNRSADSPSTTDFTLRLAVPIHDVVKTDLVQVSMDYNVANIQAPNNTFTLGQGLKQGETVITNTYLLEDGLYTIDVLAAWIQQQLGPGYSVYYGVNGKLMIEYERRVPEHPHHDRRRADDFVLPAHAACSHAYPAVVRGRAVNDRPRQLECHVCGVLVLRARPVRRAARAHRHYIKQLGGHDHRVVVR